MLQRDTSSPKAANAHTSESLTGLKSGKPVKTAAGFNAVLSSLKYIYTQSGILRGTKALLTLNQKNGYDCPSCAWPDPDNKRAITEFCENGAKAVASEITTRRIDQSFFKKHSVLELSQQSEYWLEQQGRLTEPVVLKAGSTHYEAISWDAAMALIATELNALQTPDDAIFYTSGRASNEAAFLYQLFARQLGTNNLPDCSNMCHESSGAALNPTIGIGKGTVTLDDFSLAEAVFILGQNPGTNHPRMLSALQECVRNGGKIVAVNPLKEAGLLAFAHPQEISGLLGKKTPLADLYLQVKINGDLAFLKGIAKSLLTKPDAIDHAFIEKYTIGFENYQTSLDSISWEAICSQSGLERDAIEKAAEILVHAKSAIFCWAMGLTQHKNAVITIQEIVNIQLILGNLGKPGAGLCPVRGHSNVQGDRTMGIYEKMPDIFFDRLAETFSFTPPRDHGLDTVAAIKAMHKQPNMVFIALGGNFLSATPDTDYTAIALKNCSLTVQISTKLNRSHLITGKQALILPCLGRSEIDLRGTGPQMVSMENSMGIVHSSQGKLTPASDQLQSEPAIVSMMAEATLNNNPHLPWQDMREDYGMIRNYIEQVIPGFENYNERLKKDGSFYLVNSARELDFSGIGGRARFTESALNTVQAQNKRLILMTIRSHDQFNTTIYGLDDRYRGIKNERRVIFLNREDMNERSIKPEQPVDITSHFNHEKRHAPLFLAIPYDIPKGSAAAYFPETNVLIPIDSNADISNTPTSKSIEISIKPHEPKT